MAFSQRYLLFVALIDNGGIIKNCVFCIYLATRKQWQELDLEKQANIVGNIRETLNGLVGQRLSIRANMGRSKVIESEGILMQVHPQLFIVEVERRRGRNTRQSYQYVDILTGTVELSRNGEPVFAGFIEDDSSEEPQAPQASLDF